MKDYSYLQQKWVANTYPNRNIVLEKGKGLYLFDQNGKKYIDCMSNYGVNIFGYGYLPINKAISSQLSKLITLHGSFVNKERAEASQMIVERCGPSYAQVYWSNSGAEAIEAALKFAVLTTEKNKFIAFSHAYHGKTLGALSATDGDKYKKAFFPLLWDFVHIKYDDITAVENAIDEKTAGVIIEPIQGEGGLTPPKKGYLKKVQQLCNKHNILLILDEIQSGTGRTGYFLSSHEDKVEADVVCLGKGLAGGIPVGATIFTQAVANKIPKNIHTSTFGGNPLACAGVIATLQHLNQPMLDNVRKMGRYFMSQLQKIKSSLIVEVRGKGLMIGVEVKDKRNEILKKMQEEGVLVIPAGENVVRFLPPYIITKEQVDRVFKIFKKVIDDLT
ncbi:aspartate aminotransferase family protein [Candidatus Roizmanbacteria bacterium]|nr:aspartate aminotransferase family protein [Candidatus Roizmanbacteria bacterium]